MASLSLVKEVAP
ncbi:hypothetical protein CPC197_0373A, partial [Chlamydia psittaci C1/97]